MADEILREIESKNGWRYFGECFLRAKTDRDFTRGEEK